ncbi:MAG: 4Fe-4S binding protein [Dehalococcoidales bacterium]|nr:4Fe-4S binding protein [Dehalococcoidales bacterium]
MRPAISSKIQALIIALAAGGFTVWWYFSPFPWLGIVMGILGSAFIYLILTTTRMERFRRLFFIGIFLFSLTALFIIVDILKPSSFLYWASQHQNWLTYYHPGETIGTLAYPCTRVVSQVLLGKAAFIPSFDIWQVTFPPTFNAFMLSLVPYAATGLAFGRGICGWICPFGGLSEAMVTGKKETWQLNFLKKKTVTPKGSYYSGLKEWVKDSKFAILITVILLSIFLAFPLVCTFCPVLWLSADVVFWSVIALIAFFSIILPFMTKRRWWCHICPIGAVFSLVDKISIFRVQINKNKCVQCYDCVQECRMYALSPDDLDKKRKPTVDCIRCGRCIEACPEGAVDFYFLNTRFKARGIFITLVVVAAILWYTWLIVIMADKLAGII